MPTSNEDFFTRERMQAIGLGIGRGFQSYDPDNPYAGAGAAMQATIGTEMSFEQQRKVRSERLQDLAAIEEKQIRAENRSAYRRKKEVEDEITRTLDLQKRQREAEKQWLDSMDVVGIDRGLGSRRSSKKKEIDWRLFANWFANLFGGDHPRVKGRAPISMFDELMGYDQSPQSIPARAVRGKPGEPDMWDEEMDAVDPYALEIMQGVGKSENTSNTQDPNAAPGSTYIDRNGVRRYKSTNKPFGTF
ncbi:MAG: hypothetical protein FJ308_22195 [Planctomycetes bacterium]|nr:hypothetical protein [Planctomycetota bacterium]